MRIRLKNVKITEESEYHKYFDGSLRCLEFASDKYPLVFKVDIGGTSQFYIGFDIEDIRTLNAEKEDLLKILEKYK